MRSPNGAQAARSALAHTRIFAAARPTARLPTPPAHREVAAYSKPEIFDRWNAGVRSAGQIGENVITMYDVIGEDFWSGGGVTVNRVDAALRKIGSGDVEVHINSPGGDMFEGIAIYNRLLEHPGAITVKVMGLAASAASIIAMAGDNIQIGPASFLMIHDCWVVAMGNRHELADTAKWLEPFDDAMAGVYAARTGMDKAAVAKLLDAETWMNGQQAVDQGFATALLGADDMIDDPAVAESASAHNAVRKAEIGLCRAMSRTDARALINKIKGTPGAAREPAKHDAGDPRSSSPPGSDQGSARGQAPSDSANKNDLTWLGQAAALTQQLRS